MKYAAMLLGLAGCGTAPEAVSGAEDGDLARWGGHGCHKKELVYSADTLIEGHTLAWWNARWWEWLVSIPSETSPPKGGDCTQNQDGDVFFLTGTFGGEAQFRDCTVPEDTPIFIPTYSTLLYGCPDVGGVEDCALADEGALLDLADERMETRAPLLFYSITLDGQEITGLEDYLLEPEIAYLDYEESSPSIFYFTQDQFGPGVPAQDTDCALGFHEDNICDLEPQPKPAVTFGHGVMLKPLEDGLPHELHMIGGYGQPGQTPNFYVEVTYNLTVEDEECD
jgi:hypothetical protein